MIAREFEWSLHTLVNGLDRQSPQCGSVGIENTLTTLFDRYQRIAPFYDLLDFPFEFGRYRAIRPLLFEGLSGAILDAGVGTGRNFPFYPHDSRVTGVDISPAMLARAARRFPVARVGVELRQMDVTRLDFPDRYFDAVVATFLFCVLPETLQVPALMEIGRVVKPGGAVRLLEYTRPRGGLRRTMTKIWDPWIGWAYGASFDRRTQEHISEAGLQLVGSRFVLDDLIKLIDARRK
jgi:ubiquinone/menaquinone biosynthesis C-methylase UbiE